jgi:predicted nucleic acid-binding protein
MPGINLFMDSSALIAGIISSKGAARVLLLLAEAGEVGLILSEQIVAETERNIARKAPHALNQVRQIILSTNPQIVLDPSPEEVIANLHLISHAADVSILVAAMKERTDYLVTLNTHHFILDPKVSQQSGLRIGTPGDALAWVRQQIGKPD